MPSITVNQTTLYYEVRGSGPAVLFISGATGDAGHWTEVAEALADEFTVVTYDRRANSRSPRPPNWTAAPMEEQADDAAALLRGLGLAPAVVYGNSQGAMILTSLLLRHPEIVRGAILHEPPFLGVIPDAERLGAELGQLVEHGMAMGGPSAAMELFLRAVASDDVFESLDPDVRDRMLENAEVFFGMELGVISAYVPDPARLGEVAAPCVVASGVDNRDANAELHWYREAADWLARNLGTSVVETPGGHVPQVTHPRELVAQLRPIVAEFAGAGTVHA